LDKRLGILKKDGLYVVGVFTDRGLFSTYLPTKSKNDAISHVNGSDLPLSTESEDCKVLEVIYEIFQSQTNVDPTKIKLDLSGFTEKQRKVIEAVLSIPRGRVITYADLAKKAGLPGAARFVGNVMASNRLAPVVPCHRVVSSDGFGGYGPGIDVKIAFLKREGAIAD
jgi:O-6-methylguanine DNA methyltransferase